MSGDSLTNLVSLLPTLLALAIIAVNMVCGLLRGFRKSTILLVQYIISFVVGIIVFFQAVSITYSDQLGGILSSLGPEFAEANSITDVVHIYLEMFVPTFAGVTNNAYLEQFIFAIAGLGVNLVLALICLVLIPLLVRVVLYILYLCLYSDTKAKKKAEKNDGNFKSSRLLGVAVGAVRGLACSVLTVSFITSAYFIVSGGISTNEEATKIEMFDNLGSSLGVDIDAIYQGIKKSRTTGIGALFDVIKIKDTPIDLYYTDLFASSTFTSPTVKADNASPIHQYLSSDEILQGEVAKLSLRTEGALLFNLLTDILETNAIKIVDGQVKVDRALLDTDIANMVDEYINGSVIYSDLTPLAIIGVAEAINKGDIVVDNSIKELFTEETIEDIKTLDFAKDMSSLFRIAITAAELIPVDETTNDFNFAAFEDPNTFLSFDVDKVKEIFSGLSKVKTLTTVVFPVGVGVALTTMEETIAASGIDPTELDFSKTEWSFELENLGNIYEKLVALELDVNKLLDQSVNEETGLSNGMQYIIDLCNDETIVEGVEKSDIFKDNLTLFIDTVFESDLLSQVGLVVVKTEIAKMNFQNADGSPSVLNDSIEMVKENLKIYSKEHLRLDLHELVSSCLDVTSLISVFMGNDNDLFGKLYDIKTEDLKSSLLGVEDAEGNRTGGIYALRLLNGDLNGDGVTDAGCKFATDSFIENALLTYAQDIITPSVVDSITIVNDPTDPNYDFDAWPTELNALIDAIAELQTIEEDTLTGINMNSSDLTDILPKGITNDDVDTISGAASKSKLLSGIIVDKLITNLEGDPTFGSTVSDPEIEWMDKVVKDENGDLVIEERGEFNNVLKAFIVFTDEEKDMNLENPDSLINGLAQLIKPATSESLSENVLDGLDYEEVNYFARSQVLMTALSSKISEVGGGSESGFGIVIPAKLNTEETPSAWKDWSYDNTINYDHKKGEFAKLVLVLYNAKEYAGTKEVDSEKPALNKDNILDSVVNMDKDACIVDSLILYATMSNELMKQGNGSDSIIKVRNCAKVANPATNNGIEIVDEEISKALAVIRNLNMNLTTTGFSEVGISTFLDAIKDPVEGELTRQSICESNIFNITIISKIAENDAMSVPAKYKTQDPENPEELVVNLEDADWYPAEDAWFDCELNRLLLSVCELNISDDENGGISVPGTNDILKMLNDSSDYTDKETKLDVIYDSDILAQTVTDKVEEQRSNGLLIREEAAYEWNDGVRGFLCKKEISILSKFIVESNVDIEKDDINASLVFQLIQGDPKFRMYICTSNILNYTTVDKIGGTGVVDANSTLAFPSNYLNADNTVNKLKAEWYPATDETWADCELNRLLVGIVDLEVNAAGNDISFPINEKMDALLNPSIVEPVNPLTGEENTKLDVIYHSDIMAMTISRKLNDTGSTSESSKGITIPTVKYNGSTIYTEVSGRISLEDKVIVENEVELLLVGVMKALGMTFDAGGFQYSNILENVEISKLISEYTTGKTRLDALLDSAILHYIISDNLIAQNQTVSENGETKAYAIVTNAYYSKSGIAKADVVIVNEYDYVVADEIVNTINALGALGINSIEDASTINLGHLTTYFGSNAVGKDELIAQVTESAILSKIFSQILVSNNILAAIDAVYHQTYCEKLETVIEANDLEEVDIITQQDLSKILNTYGDMFDLYAQ